MAHMCALRQIQGVISSDSDMFMFGAPRCSLWSSETWRAPCSARVALVALFQQTIAEGVESPLEWLVLAAAGSSQLGKASLLIHSCVAHSDFNMMVSVRSARLASCITQSLSCVSARRARAKLHVDHCHCTGVGSAHATCSTRESTGEH
mmetsp:Transcript_13205/g.34403  ORF Transcript_13205/g.34403 Transcript_13205/m.34403 type:complete len:149 (-) Transcript_13205:238-684(-)